MQETLRLYPPVAVGQIRCNLHRDVVLAGCLTLPRGTAVWVPHGALHTAAFNWPDPDAFLPGRPQHACVIDSWRCKHWRTARV